MQDAPAEIDLIVNSQVSAVCIIWAEQLELPNKVAETLRHIETQ